MITKTALSLLPRYFTETPASLVGTEDDAKKLLQGLSLDKTTQHYPDVKLKAEDSFYLNADEINMMRKERKRDLKESGAMGQAIYRYLKANPITPSNGVLFTSKDIPLDIAAHEAGHATATGFRRAMQDYVYPYGDYGGVGIGVALGAMKGGKIGKGAGAALIGLSAIPTVAQLAEEGISSIKGYKKLKELGMLKDDEAARLARKRLATAWGTYALGQALNTGIGYVMLKDPYSKKLGGKRIG